LGTDVVASELSGVVGGWVAGCVGMSLDEQEGVVGSELGVVLMVVLA